MWKPVHIYIPYFLFWTDEQFILELSLELLLPYDGVACTLVRRGVTYVLWWIGIWIPLSATLTLVTPNKWCSLFVVYWLRFLLKFEPLMVSASFVFNSSWRCGQRIRIRMRMRMVAMLWSQARAPLTKVWQLSQGCEVHRDIGGDYRVIWEIADQITRATVNCFLVTCQ